MYQSHTTDKKNMQPIDMRAYSDTQRIELRRLNEAECVIIESALRQTTESACHYEVVASEVALPRLMERIRHLE